MLPDSLVPGRAIPFDSGTVTVPGTGSYTLIAHILLSGRDVVVHGLVGANALTGLKITQAATPGGTHKDLLVGTDFDTATITLPYVLGSSIATTAGAGTFQFRLNSGASEIKIYAKASSASSLALTGLILKDD